MKYGQTLALIAMALFLNAGSAVADSAKTVRATALTPQVMNDIQHGTAQDVIIEFRQGDRLPVTFQATGDLLESNQIIPSYVVVKRPFWVQVAGNKFTISLDGLNYKKFTDVVGGSFTLGAGDAGATSGTANAINMLLNAYLK